MQRERTATEVEGGARAGVGEPAHVRWGNAIAGALIAFATMVLLWGTLNDYGMAWDEGYTVEREERLREWFARVADDSTPSRAWPPSLSRLEPRGEYLRRAGPEAAAWQGSGESLGFYGQFAREEPNGHPPF